MKSEKKSSRQLFILILCVSLFTGACRKKETSGPDATTPDDTEQITVSDNSLAENLMTEIESFGSEVSEEGALGQNRESGTTGLTAASCASVSGIGTKTVVVDFGSGCLGQDGRTRSGRLIYDLSASTPSTAVFYRNPGFNMQVTSQNYVVDAYSVTITNKQVVNTTPANIPTSGYPGINFTWAVTASVSVAKPNGGGTVVWNCSRTKELMTTADTNCYRGQFNSIVWRNAVVKINGTSTGVNARNENYTAVASNLIRDFTCAPDALRPARHPFISGTLQYTPGNRLSRLLNYGNGACDLNAVLTIGTRTSTITLN